MKIKFVAGFSPIVVDPSGSASFYQDGIGITFDESMGDYLYTHTLPGTKHMGLWPLAEAAEACFGTSEWPQGITVPQATIEFEVEDVAAGEKELREKGYELLHSTRTEPWGQITARLLSPEGLLIGLVSTPWLND